MTKKIVWIAAGGTGGHVIPGLVLAKALREKGVHVTWLGTKTGIEAQLVTQAGFFLHTISAKPLRGRGWQGLLEGMVGLLRAMWQVIFLLCQERPSLVISMGGYVAAPVGLVAKICAVPLVLHEQNAIMGATNRLLAKFAQKIFLAFPLTKLSASRVMCTGNPVRSEIMRIGQFKEDFGQKKSPLRCLVLGGSRGATTLNTMVQSAWQSLPEEQRPLLWHQVGQVDYANYQKHYAKGGEKVRVSAFIEDMAAAYVWADVVIARAGAMTVSECLSAGLPVAWVPLPWATDNHQQANAEYFCNVSQGWLWSQKHLSSQIITRWWSDCQTNLQDYHDQAKYAASQQPDALAVILAACLAIVE